MNIFTMFLIHNTFTVKSYIETGGEYLAFLAYTVAAPASTHTLTASLYDILSI